MTRHQDPTSELFDYYPVCMTYDTLQNEYKQATIDDI